MQRLFFSLKFSNAQQQQLLPYQAQALTLCDNARAVDTDNLHLTLFFLGQVDTVQLQRLVSAAQSIKLPVFNLCLDYLACFTKAKILYLAPSNIPAELLSLQQILATRCQTMGFIDIHPKYRPHITLARHGLTESVIQVTPLCLRVVEFALYCSENIDGKVRYRPLHIFQLQ